MHYLGEISCLSAALCWAVAVTIFRKPIGRHGALAVNLFKCILASIALSLTVWFSGQWGRLFCAPLSEVEWLMASALTGLVIGDSALFAAVKRIGGHSTLLLQTLSPIFAVGLAVALGERLSAAQWLGAAIIMSGVILVVVSKNEDGGVAKMALSGIAFGLLAAFGQGVGLVLAKMGMQTMPVLPATLVRLLTASVGMAVVLALTGGFSAFRSLMGSSPALKRVLPASLIGTYVAMMLMMTGVALAPASVAAVLLSMPPVFSLVVEGVVDRRRPSFGALAGTIISLIGVAVLSLAV